MELIKTKKEKPNILAEITCIQQPRYAQYITNNRVVIAGEDGCSIVDPTTNKEIKKISDVNIHHLAIHPNKTLFALSHENTNSFDIYNAETNSLICSKTVDDPIRINSYDRIEYAHFCPHDTTLFLMLVNCINGTAPQTHSPIAYKITKYNYTTHQHNTHRFQSNIWIHLFAFHPTQNKMCMIHPAYDISIYEPDIIISPEAKLYSQKSYGHYHKQFCQYNPDGSYIALGDCQSKIYIINSQKIDQYYEFKKGTEKYQREDFKRILFYSNSILAISSALYINTEKDPSKGKMQNSLTRLFYFDIHKKRLIHTDELLDVSKQYDFSFSPDKAKVIITLTNKYIELPVPFNVMYKNITKKEFPYLLFLLKNYTSQCDDIEIPQDINVLLAQTLLDLYRRE